MQGLKTVVGMDWSTGDGIDGEVNLWADSVGSAARQLGVIVVLAIAVHLATSLVLGM
jgi:hypothetical protein